MKQPAILLGLLLITTPVLAQESASYRITEDNVNAGGRVSGPDVPSSASFQVTLGSIGDAAVGRGLASASYSSNASFAGCFPPPGEVQNLRFTNATTFAWEAEPSAGIYNVYRGRHTSPASGFDPGYGTCQLPSGPGLTRTDIDISLADGETFFYLVTVSNLLSEEGTKGSDRYGNARPNPVPCP